MIASSKILTALGIAGGIGAGPYGIAMVSSKVVSAPPAQGKQGFGETCLLDEKTCAILRDPTWEEDTEEDEKNTWQEQQRDDDFCGWGFDFMPDLNTYEKCLKYEQEEKKST
ncbi:hypothetical protein MHLP_02730 [Candidatus Mycoplasma haematolamae str. Purdue]|uniref:Uncharacterized protein n=1 Tax=Mycoplasma haematolamae (strain Purdue) TaxID=1212765 RepID=I7CFX3_MYCHA|nr:hypothetical protein [Candidatus Mycoplasma haematolamae]AFO52126.1 hypothetical protein MHLP_02730 [Candidatus Mycoplasma haematolamae str. Purdue]